MYVRIWIALDSVHIFQYHIKYRALGMPQFILIPLSGILSHNLKANTHVSVSVVNKHIFL